VKLTASVAFYSVLDFEVTVAMVERMMRLLPHLVEQVLTRGSRLETLDLSEKHLVPGLMETTRQREEREVIDVLSRAIPDNCLTTLACP